jgi:hypothetical protein
METEGLTSPCSITDNQATNDRATTPAHATHMLVMLTTKGRTLAGGSSREIRIVSAYKHVEMIEISINAMKRPSSKLLRCEQRFLGRLE